MHGKTKTINKHINTQQVRGSLKTRVKNNAEKGHRESSEEGENFSSVYGKVREELTEKKRTSQQGMKQQEAKE